MAAPPQEKKCVLTRTSRPAGRREYSCALLGTDLLKFVTPTELELIHLVRQGYEVGVTRRSVCDGWARRRGLSLSTPPAARVARGGSLGASRGLPRQKTYE